VFDGGRDLKKRRITPGYPILAYVDRITRHPRFREISIFGYTFFGARVTRRAFDSPIVEAMNSAWLLLSSSFLTDCRE